MTSRKIFNFQTTREHQFLGTLSVRAAGHIDPLFAATREAPEEGGKIVFEEITVEGPNGEDLGTGEVLGDLDWLEEQAVEKAREEQS